MTRSVVRADALRPRPIDTDQVSLAATASALADTWGMHDTGSGWWVVMLISMLAFWGLVAAGAVWLIRQPSARADRPGQPLETPREILDRRLVSGEITATEYQHYRSLLDHQPTPDTDREGD